MSGLVQRLVFNHSGDRILISTTSSDPLWLLSDQATSKCLATMPFAMSTRRQLLPESKDANDLHFLLDNEFADI